MLLKYLALPHAILTSWPPVLCFIFHMASTHSIALTNTYCFDLAIEILTLHIGLRYTS